MVLDREKRSGQDEQEDEQEQPSGELFVYWVPQEADAQRGNTRERLHGVRRVELREGVGDYDEGELVAHTEGGVAVFDRHHIRGWRTEGEVEVPDTALSHDDSEGS